MAHCLYLSVEDEIFTRVVELIGAFVYFVICPAKLELDMYRLSFT
jgi:hypothetical protein